MDGLDEGSTSLDAPQWGNEPREAYPTMNKVVCHLWSILACHFDHWGRGRQLEEQVDTRGDERLPCGPLWMLRGDGVANGQGHQRKQGQYCENVGGSKAKRY